MYVVLTPLKASSCTPNPFTREREGEREREVERKRGRERKREREKERQKVRERHTHVNTFSKVSSIVFVCNLSIFMWSCGTNLCMFMYLRGTNTLAPTEYITATSCCEFSPVETGTNERKSQKSAVQLLYVFFFQCICPMISLSINMCGASILECLKFD